MHPAELKNLALAAAVAAEIDGFHATAQAFLDLAISFQEEVKLYAAAFERNVGQNCSGAQHAHGVLA